MKRHLLLRTFCSLLLFALVSALASAQTRETFQVPMRDGAKLATDVFLPAGAGPFAVILARTPYSKDASAGSGTNSAKAGYAMVIQDVRGRFASEGENLPFDTDSWGTHADGFDTLEWIAKQPWCNGRIGTYGGSAGAITQYLLAGSGTDKVTCQHLTVGEPNLYHGVYQDGVFRKALIEDWLRLAKFGPSALPRWVNHPVYDEYWRERDLTARFDKVNWPAVHIGGWYDIFAQGTIDAFVGYQTKGGPKARGHQKLLMGPWTHGVLQEKAGELKFPNAKRPPNNVHDFMRWFDSNLKGADNGIAQEAAVTYYAMGDASDPNAPGNVWRTAAQWPPVRANPTRFYFHDDKTLSRITTAKEASLTFVCDPKDPVPTVGGPQLSLPAGPINQRHIEGRYDVLVFTSAALTEPLEVTGRVRVKLWAKSDAPDADFFAKLCDVYPDGRSYNICEGIVRARFRESVRRERMLKPGQVYPFDLDLWSTSIIFNRGHRLRVHITSSSAPGYDPNPNAGEPFRASFKTRVARNTIYLDGQRASHILLPVALASP